MATLTKRKVLARSKTSFDNLSLENPSENWIGYNGIMLKSCFTTFLLFFRISIFQKQLCSLTFSEESNKKCSEFGLYS
jgi:hypothetical protein